MRQYHLEVQGDLFFTQAVLKHQGRIRVVKLLVDCGASQAIFSWGTLISLGIDPAISTSRRRIVTANGAIYVLETTLGELDALGQRAENLNRIFDLSVSNALTSGGLDERLRRKFRNRPNDRSAVFPQSRFRDVS